MKKILIIEDDPIVGKIYYSAFKKSGFEVELAADGQEGYYKVQQGKFDGLLLDLMLPHMSGLDILRKIRAQRTFQKLIVVVFTNSFESEVFDSANEAGANRIFHKSNLTPKDLVEVMNQEFFLARRSPGWGVGGEAAAAGDSDDSESTEESYRLELIQTFLKKAPESIEALEEALILFFEATSPTEISERLRELYRRLHSFSGVAGLAGLTRLGELCDAMEALLIEMHENTGANNISTRRTLSRAVAFLRDRFHLLAEIPDATARSGRVLVVDEELMARRAAFSALDLNGLEVVASEDARASLELLAKRAFNLVVLDETMPGLSGSQILARLRQGPPNQKTPAILILGKPEFEARQNEKLPDNLDFIARPFPFSEMAVKALSMMLNHQIIDLKPLKLTEDE